MCGGMALFERAWIVSPVVLMTRMTLKMSWNGHGDAFRPLVNASDSNSWMTYLRVILVTQHAALISYYFDYAQDVKNVQYLIV